MAVLYRKYRPQTFAEVVGQKPIIQTLKNQIQSGSVAHAYLFTGSRGVGKTSVARILAKAVNCVSVGRRVGEPASAKASADKSEVGKDGVGDACGVCDNCKAIAAGSFLDLVEIDAASNTGVDNIRELIEHVKFSPSVGKYKVFIIDEVHMLSKGAFNALLKTLEEPPKHAIFILATTEIGKVPATIISRTQRFDFKAYSAEDLMPLLEKISQEEKINFSREVLLLVAQNAEGSARDALSLLGKLLTLGTSASTEEVQQLLGITDFATSAELLEIIKEAQSEKVPEFFDRLGQKGADYSVFNRDFLEFLRKVLISKVGGEAMSFGLSQENEAKLKALAQSFQVSDLIYIVRLFLKAYKDLPASPVPQVPLLMAGIEAAVRGSANRQIGGSESRSVGKSAGRKVGEPEVGSNVVMSAKSEIKISPIVKVESETIVQQETVIVGEGNLASLEEIQAIWSKLIAKIKEINGPLASMLRNTQLLEVLPGKIIVGVRFAFDKKSLEIAKNSQLICSNLEDLTGKKLAVIGQVISQDPANVVNATEAVAEALKIFGGELVE